MVHKYRRAIRAAIAGAAASSLPVVAAQAVEVTSSGGWGASFDGNISEHMIYATASTLGGTSSDARATRFTSGWNPSKFNAHFKAPEFEGLTVTGNFQYATNITCPQTVASGGEGKGFDCTQGGHNREMDVRVLQLDIAGAFGTFSVGRGWGIFNSQAILNDAGSGIGVGELCGSPGGWNGGTCGRIGTGYSWTAFDSKLEYDTPELHGLSLRVGMFDPTNALAANVGLAGAASSATAFNTKTPRFEAEATWASKFDGGGLKVWAGGLYQSLNSLSGGPTSSISGVDGGAHVDFRGFGLTGAYTSTKGFGGGNSSLFGGGGFKSGFAGSGGISCTPASCIHVSAKQWYAEADYTIGNAMFGVSDGQGKQEANLTAGFPQIKSTLAMAYWHQKLTKQLTLVVEYDWFKGQSQGVTDNKYSLFSIGPWFDF